MKSTILFCVVIFLVVSLNSLNSCPLNRRTREVTDTPTCVMNFCDFSSPCLNDGTCVFNSSTCAISCACSDGYTGIYCEKVSTSATTTSDSLPTRSSDDVTTISEKSTTLRAYSNRSCDGFVCYHGVCDRHLLEKDQYKCVCDDGYYGHACEKRCERNCSVNGICKVNPSTSREYCNCMWPYTGSFCEKRLPEDLVNMISNELHVNSTTPTITTTVCSGFNLCKFMSTVCFNGGTCEFTSLCETKCHCTEDFTGQNCETSFSEDFFNTTTATSSIDTTTLRPYENRSCNGFVCYHGVCDAELLSQGKYKCQCDSGFYGHLCETRCGRNCSVNGICKLNRTTEAEYCNCRWPYTGDHCENIIPKELAEAGWVWWVVGSCTFLLVLLVLLLVLLPYWMWRKRDVFIMKIVYYFQPYEDDDNKQFDAFISYTSRSIDEDFVLNTLYPVLEKELNFKLCLHQRDFIPGETIANNIIWAVENSRRTILVLTPNYLESEFTRFEWQRAHAEMLKMQQKIIPIILDDIKAARSFMDGTMKIILDSITYIEWPGLMDSKAHKRFWKQLELSMPKKKCKEESSNRMAISGLHHNTLELSVQGDHKDKMSSKISDRQTLDEPIFQNDITVSVNDAVDIMDDIAVSVNDSVDTMDDIAVSVNHSVNTMDDIAFSLYHSVDTIDVDIQGMPAEDRSEQIRLCFSQPDG